MTGLPSPDDRSQPVCRDFWRLTGLFCAVAVLWLVTRPYFGVVFDARFYMVEALNALDRTSFAEDLYFKFGSQGNFSVFTQFYLPLLRLFGVGATGMILAIAGQLLWLFGLFRLARSLVGGQIMWLSIAVVIGTLRIYAGGFGYGEPYVTARLYAEALVMLGLAFLPSKPRWTVLLLALAAPIHPLMALPGIAVAFVYLALGRPVWWLVIGAGMGLAAALGLAGIAPFSNLLRTIDPEWFAIINVRSFYSFLTNWSRQEFVQVLASVAWVVGALALLGRDHRRFLIATLVVGVGGLACAYVGGDIAHNLLLVQIQPWRSMWLLQLVSRIYVPLIFATLLARKNFDGLRWATLLSIGLILASSMTWILRFPDSAEFTLGSLVLESAGLTVMAVQLLLGQQKYRPIAVISVLVGFALLPVALWRWDARAPGLKYMESPEPPPKDLAALLPAGASVYWENGFEMLWFRFNRASYFSCAQGTGAMFYRQTAMVYKHRTESFLPLYTADFDKLDTCAAIGPRPKPERNRKGLQNICIREPELDYLVLSSPLDGVTPRIWKSPVLFQYVENRAGVDTPFLADRFYIYSCGSVRG